MAVTITRTAWIDDDGTGTSGTVINNAEKTTIYNQIDAALALVPQLAGGNAFTGNQSIAGSLTVSGSAAFSLGTTGGTVVTVQNTLAGAANFAAVFVTNDASVQCIAQVFASTWAPSGPYLPSGAALRGTGANGLSIAAEHATGAIRCYTGGLTERLRIDSAGVVSINNQGSTIPFAPRLGVVSDLTASNAIVIQNSNAGNTGNFMMFGNSAGQAAGFIGQASATTVTFGTSSDARLKDDAGPATDVAALRRVVVHDFTWKADGVRDRGIFAQEAHALYPRAVVEGTDETTDDGLLARPWMTDYSKFVPDLIAGWQQHDAELAALRAAFATLKG
jgi:hypothetical protein